MYLGHRYSYWLVLTTVAVGGGDPHRQHRGSTAAFSAMRRLIAASAGKLHGAGETLVPVY
jgi:hypothetical protein